MFASNFGSGLFRLIQSLHRGDKTEYSFIPKMKAKAMNPKGSSINDVTPDGEGGG